MINSKNKKNHFSSRYPHTQGSFHQSASSPMLSQPSSPSQSRTASPTRSVNNASNASGNVVVTQGGGVRAGNGGGGAGGQGRGSVRNSRRPSIDTTPPPPQQQSQIITMVDNEVVLPQNLKGFDDVSDLSLTLTHSLSLSISPFTLSHFLLYFVDPLRLLQLLFHSTFNKLAVLFSLVSSSAYPYQLKAFFFIIFWQHLTRLSTSSNSFVFD